jgi:hypothetical protein
MRPPVTDDAPRDPVSLRRTLACTAPPPGLPPALDALWWLAKGDWERAHLLAQADPSGDGAWVHAHLHRVEGDANNAAHWYDRAGREPSSGSLRSEWDEIVSVLCGRGVRRRR